MTAAVVIVTKNRCDDLRVAVRSALAQRLRPEVIVIDDGSSDGTAAMMTAEFSAVRFEPRADSRGYIVRRNEAARLTGADVIFSIDDDAEFTSPLTVEQTLAEFDDPRISAVAIPYVEPRKANELQQLAPTADARWIADTFIGTAHALRRQAFLAVGGYDEQLVHQGEERDLCLRLLSRGMVVRLGRADRIEHYESPRRDLSRMDYYGRRNDILFAWRHVPGGLLPIHLAGTTINAARSAWQAGRLWHMSRGTLAGYAACARQTRQPVTAAVYRLHRRLKRHGPFDLAAIQADLPPCSLC